MRGLTLLFLLLIVLADFAGAEVDEGRSVGARNLLLKSGKKPNAQKKPNAKRPNKPRNKNRDKPPQPTGAYTHVHRGCSAVASTPQHPPCPTKRSLAHHNPQGRPV